MSDDNSTDVAMGGRSAQVWKFDSSGKPLETTPEDAAQAAIIHMPANAEAKRVGSLGWGYDFARDIANKGVALAGQYTPIDAGQAILSKASGGKVPMPPGVSERLGLPADPEGDAAAARGVAPYIVPQTPAAAVTQAALGPFSKLGFLKSALASSAAGAGANAVTGNDAGQGALTGAVGNILPRVVAPALKWVSGIPGRISGKVAAETSEGLAHADRLLKGMGEDIPELASSVARVGRSPSEKLYRIQDAKVGPAALGTMMDVAEKPIERALPNAQFVIPQPPGAAPAATGAAASMTPQQLAKMQALGFTPPGATQAPPQTVGIGTAMRELKNLKAEAREVFSRDNPMASIETTKRAVQLEDDIYNVVAAHDPEMATAWKTAMDKYAKGLDYLNLAKATVRGESAAHTPVDVAGSFQHIFDRARDFSQSRMPGLMNNLSPAGAEIGTQTTVNDPLGHARLFMPGAVHGKLNVPSPAVLTRPGPKPGIDIPPAAMVPGLLNLSQSGLDALRGR